MASKKQTRRALFMSVVSLMLCVAMLAGTTFAWFTDEVTSDINTITAGNLDVELYHSDKAASNEKVTADTKLFDDVKLWEPGAVAYENFEVANEGNLALKYQLSINFSEETVVSGHGLSEALKVAVVEGGFTGDRADAEKLTNLVSLKSFVLSGELEGTTKSKTYGVVIYWQPTENDNNFNMKDVAKNEDGSAVDALTIKLGVNLFATQEMYEEDSFGSDYDESASMKTTANADGSALLSAASAPSATTNETTVEAPAGAFKADDEVEIVVESDNSLFNVNSKGAVVASLDVTLLVNGEEAPTELTNGAYTVTTYISTGLDKESVEVHYVGTDGKADVEQDTVTYDPATGKLTFQTTHFSEYEVTAKAYGYSGDTAYGTAKDAADAVAGGADVTIDDADKQTVVEANSDAKKALAVVKGSWNSSAYLTLKEAFVDAHDNGTITLLDDIAVSEGVTVDKGMDITLDLNSKTISGIDNATGSFGLITNQGNLTITGEGKITLTAKNNRGWNAYSSVLSNTVGGKLTVQSGTIEHLGGTDMAYGIDNLTNGKGTYAETIINGGTVKSTYRAIRMFLNGTEADNILTVNGGTIEGANKSIWMQDPSKNANTGKLTVKEGAKLNGDVYLYVCEGSAKWPVEVSIAASAVNGEVLSGNVPAGYQVCEVDGYWTVIAPTKVSTAAELSAAVKAGGGVMLTDNIILTSTLMATEDVVIDLNGKTITAPSSGAMFQSQSNAAPSMIITSSEAGAKINAGVNAVLLGYGSTEFSNVEINVGEIKSSSYTTFQVYGDLTLGTGTVVNVDYLGTSLISNNGAVDIVIDGATINIGTFKTNGSAVISLTKGTTLALNKTAVKVGLDTTYISYFISKAENVTIDEKCTFEIKDSGGAAYGIEKNVDENVGTRYAWVKQ